MTRPYTHAMRRAAVVCLLLSSIAHADATRTPADQRFEDGRKLMVAGKFEAACTAFEDSQQLDPAVTTLLNLGACREKASQLASAVTVFRAAERAARQEGAKSAELAKIAAAHVKRLEPRLSTMTVMVPRAQRIDGLVIERGGTRIDAKQWDLPVPIDGGTYELVARAPGHSAWSKTIVVDPERDAKTIYVPDLPDAPEGEVTPDIEPSPPREGRSVVLPIVLGVAALGAGGAAFYFNQRGDEIYAQAKVEPDPARQDALWHSANRRRYAAEGFAAAGLGCAVVAVWLLVRGGGASADQTVALRPTASADGFSVQLVGSY
jgi:hypothetical protein